MVDNPCEKECQKNETDSAVTDCNLGVPHRVADNINEGYQHHHLEGHKSAVLSGGLIIWLKFLKVDCEVVEDEHEGVRC